jgi:hypothetical protein
MRVERIENLDYRALGRGLILFHSITSIPLLYSPSISARLFLGRFDIVRVCRSGEECCRTGPGDEATDKKEDDDAGLTKRADVEADDPP